MNAKKRAFDLVVALVTIPLWLPILIVTAIAILVCAGMPIFYSSRRRYHRQNYMTIVKFRTMRKLADRTVNRDTVPVNGQRFLNIPFESPMYTSVGRWIERFCITELPQLYHVFRGQMTIVGNRPLPENVVNSIREVIPGVDARFATPAGLTGPVQLVGRDELPDDDRVRLEIRYCWLCENNYSPMIDFMILLTTVLICLRIKPKMTPAQVERKLDQWCGMPSSSRMPVTANEEEHETHGVGV